jgi:hypothetical protein
MAASGEIVPHDGGPVVAAPWIIQPSTRPLGGAETIGAQKDVLQLPVRVAIEGRVSAQRADGVDQREWELGQCVVKFCERRCDPAGREHSVEAEKPRLRRVGVELGQVDVGGGGGRDLSEAVNLGSDPVRTLLLCTVGCV